MKRCFGKLFQSLTILPKKEYLKELTLANFVCILYGWLAILGDPGADSGDEGKSKRAGKCGTKKSKEQREEPFFTLYFSARLDFRSPPLSAPGSPRMMVGSRVFTSTVLEIVIKVWPFRPNTVF